MSSSQVLLIIASLDGGYNGDVLGKQIGVTVTGDETAIYTLTDTTVEPPVVETYDVTVTPVP